MEVTYTHCAGLDIHKKTVVASCLITTAGGKVQRETRTFSTMTQDLLALSDWLLSRSITHTAMESTGEYWKPVYNILEANFEVLVVNAKHMKNVPGRKTDVLDSEWIVDLLRHGLLRGSFIPPLVQRDLRDLTRQRTNLVQERACVVNRLQKVLEWANIKLTSVVTDINGVSARLMLKAITTGETDVNTLAAMARGRLRNKREELHKALSGNIRDHHRFLIANHLTHLDFLDEQIAVFEAKIVEAIQAQTPSTPSQPTPPATAIAGGDSIGSNGLTLSWEEAVVLLDTIPGVGLQTAQMLIAEIGTDMSRFKSDAHLAKWAHLCPGNHESAGKRYSGRTGSANNWLRSGLIQAAQAAVKCKGSYLSAFFHRLAGRRGRKKAIVAVAHRILRAVYHILSKRQPFQDLGANYFDKHRCSSVVDRLCARIKKLGYQVNLQPLSTIPL